MNEHPFSAVMNCPLKNQSHGYRAMRTFPEGRVFDDIEKCGAPDRTLELGMETLVLHLRDAVVATWEDQPERKLP